jgi:hypothetical protein
VTCCGPHETISAVSVFDLLSLIEPHPDLVAAKHPTPLQVTEAAGLLGWLPDDDDRLFRPAVSARGGV